MEKTEQVFAEYLGDVQISHLLKHLENTNPHVNSLKDVPSQRYNVAAEFDETHKLVRLVLTVDRADTRRKDGMWAAPDGTVPPVQKPPAKVG